ncbi:MAG: TonB-dependent receptor [Candidatus Cryptobacteroides sp.]
MRVKILLASLLALVINYSVSAMQIDLKLNNVTVKEAIAALNKMENWSIIVNSDEIDLSRKVSIDVSGASIDDVLNQIFAGQNVTYVINGSRVSITGKRVDPEIPEKVHTIKGKVLDPSGEPLPAASLMVKGTKTGFFTDVDGNFELSGISYPATLVVSYIGFSDKEVVVNGTETSLSISLDDIKNLLNDVVVVGYGTQKRVNLTGAVSVIDGKDLNNRPVTNTAMALQGADPSLLLTTGNGSIAGDQYKVSIRGSVSLNSGSPLILIDGIEGSLAQVNPNDIESISVLKDASACAIYGAKASAGVVLITTKNGADGKAIVTYNGRFSISDNTTSTDYITSGYDYVTLTNEFYTYTKGYGAWTYTDAQLEMMKERRYDKKENPARPWVVPDETGTYTYLYLGNFDWYGFLLNKTRPETEHNITVRGGTDKVTYYASGRYLYREGLFAGKAKDKYNGYSFRSKMDVKMTKWLNYSNNISFERTDYSYGGFMEIDGSEKLMSNGILYDLMRNVGPNIVPYNPDGTINIQSGYMADATSPLFSGRGGVFMDGRNRNKVVNNYLTLTNRFTFNIAKGLQFIADYTYRRRDETKAYRSLPSANCYDNANKRMYKGADASVPQGQFTNGSVYDFYQESRYYNDGHVINAFFKYNGSFGKGHNLGVTAGGNFDDYRSSTLVNKQKGSLSESLSYINMANGEIIKASESNSAYRTLGFFGRINYDFKGRYLVELSGRVDGSSRFPADHRWGFFPSASAGWRISEEQFWQNLKNAVNNAKVRLSYGTLGNQQVNNYYYWDTISTGLLNYTFDGSGKAGYAQASAPVSSSLTWETVISKNLGIDLGFLKGRLNLSADFYIRDTKDMLTKAKTLPYVYGETAPKENAADLRTKGYELSLGWRDTFKLASRPFSYGITATLGDYQTHITKFDNDSKLLSDHYVGKRLGDIWGYVSDGLFATDEEAAAYEAAIDSKGTVHKGVFACKAPYNHLLAGDIRFKDLDGNGKIDSGKNTLDEPGDRRVIGNKLPRYNYSIKGDFNWLGIDLSFFFQGVGKMSWMPSSGCLYFYGPYAFERPSFITKDFNSKCWSSEEGADNSDVVFPRKRGNLVKGSNLVNSDYFLQNAAYLRLKNLTLGYTLPVKSKAIERARIYFSGENLFYISPLKKACKTIDPEVATTTATNDSMYPYSRTFSIGVDITF